MTSCDLHKVMKGFIYSRSSFTPDTQYGGFSGPTYTFYKILIARIFFQENKAQRCQQ